MPSGDAVIRKAAGSSEIVITTTRRLAGAIHSLTWNGKEFIDSADHGRQLQSACNFDLGTPITAETFNPTEAGSRRDGAGNLSSSRLLHLRFAGNQLQSTTQMAFWLVPGEKSDSNPAKNETTLSDHLLTKRVTIGFRDLPQVIVYDVTFSMPLGEHHTHAVFEAVTGYMPAEFEKFWQYDAASSKLEELSDGPGEIGKPVVLATTDGQHAMGVYSPDQPSPNWNHVGYGRFRFVGPKVVKWNCVFRVTNDRGIPACEYSFRNFVIVGDLATVRTSLARLHEIFPKGK